MRKVARSWVSAGIAFAAGVLTSAESKNIEECFHDLYDMYAPTNIAEDAYVELIKSDPSQWRVVRNRKLEKGREYAFRDWFKSLATASLPDDGPYMVSIKCCRDGKGNIGPYFDSCEEDGYFPTNVIFEVTAEVWHGARESAMSCFDREEYISGDTNCWFAVAGEIGRIRSALHEPGYWLRSVDESKEKKEFYFNGKVYPYSKETYLDVFMELDLLSRDKNIEEWNLSCHASRMESSLGTFAKSRTFREMQPEERNAVASNLVALAKMKPRRAVEYGLLKADAIPSGEGKEPGDRD